MRTGESSPVRAASPLGEGGFPDSRELALPLGRKISVRNCPKESRLQDYTVSSNPKAVMVSKGI